MKKFIRIDNETVNLNLVQELCLEGKKVKLRTLATGCSASYTAKFSSESQAKLEYERLITWLTTDDPLFTIIEHR